MIPSDHRPMSVEKCPKVSRSVQKCPTVSEIVEKCCKVPKSVEDCALMDSDNRYAYLVARLDNETRVLMYSKTWKQRASKPLPFSILLAIILYKYIHIAITKKHT
jgi:hypothetical protein